MRKSDPSGGSKEELELSLYGRDYYSGYVRRSRWTGRLIPHKKGVYRFWLGWLMKRLDKGEGVLEVGCGPGHFGVMLHSQFQYSGIDLSPYAIQQAREIQGLSSVKVESAEQLTHPDESVSAVVAFDVIEHLPHPDAFFKQAWRVLKPDGFLILSTPNPESLGNRLKTAGSSNPPSMYKDVTHIHLLNKREWVEKLDFGFHIHSSGSDFIWDLPYVSKRMIWIEKALLIPPNLLFNRFLGFVKWTLGENLLLVAQKKEIS